MKIASLIVILFLTGTVGIAQNFELKYEGRTSPVVKKTTLENVEHISEIIPDFWKKMHLPAEYRGAFSHALSACKEKEWRDMVDVHSVEISTFCNGVRKVEISENLNITAEQKEILRNADIGMVINIFISFTPKGSLGISNNNEIITGICATKVVSEVEAKYPGGFAALSSYLNKNMVTKLEFDDLPDYVNFKVDEEGHVIDVTVMRLPGDKVLAIDSFIEEVFEKMPNWSPARTISGSHVKQEFTIPFLGKGC